jgi:hypothetical protein
MIAIRQIEQVVTDTVTIRLPTHFAARRVEVIVLPLEEDKPEQEQIQRLLLTAPISSENDLQGFTQVREWMNQWTVSAF